MKEKRECSVVQDLLPNYIERLTSEGTNQYIEVHLKDCKECTKILENMQKDLTINVPKRDNREVKYIKKFNKKMKLLRVILIVILLIIILFVGNLIRKVCIIQQYTLKSMQYCAGITNFYRKSIEEDLITEIWRKDDIALSKTTYANGEIMWSYWGKDSNWGIINKIGSDQKNAVEFEKGFGIPWIGTSTIQPTDIWSSIRIAFQARITTENVNGEECYKIHLDNNFEEYITKKDFLMIKNINGSTNAIIQYKINTVTDEDVKMPDLTGYNIIRIKDYKEIQ